MTRTAEHRATLREVAAEAGVSTATVSRVFSGADPVAPETIERVREVAARLGYEPSRIARSLRRRRTSNLGLVLPSFTNAFFLSLIAQTVAIGREAGYSVLVAGGDDPEAEALELIRGQVVDGIILVAAHGSERATRLADVTIPIVCFDRAPADLDRTTVQVDNAHGARLVTEHLIAAGARRIAHIAGPPQVSASTPRREGFLAALDDAGLEPRGIVEGDFSLESGRERMRDLLEQDPAVDAVFAANDLMAIGAMRAAAELGRTVPAEVRVAGFDGIAPGAFVVPGLTTYAQPMERMARTAVHRLLELVEGGEQPRDARELVLQGELVVRESAGTAEPPA
jgi:LacI family transcriptional regulator